jgi:hypothetical protein
MDLTDLKMDTAIVYFLVAALIAFVIFSVCPGAGSSSSGSWLPQQQNNVEGFSGPPSSPDNLNRPSSVNTSLVSQANGAPEDWSQYAPKPSAELGGVALLDPVKFIGQSTLSVAKNNSLDIRTVPNVPKKTYTWNNSSLMPGDFLTHQSIDQLFVCCDPVGATPSCQTLSRIAR